ncbi:Hypothetical predicted protein [Mytilus galloprovincialis]|uniref:Uncharacterized protein n=1 Tax=Mytilus galloprovincialis TaxID=29158 RepID=A0A8B6ELP1_MYTGA|nr:Hypothetical predicted protein [Mytilus galloprovincialis]
MGAVMRIVFLFILIYYVSSSPIYKKRMSREMKETHILLQQFFGDKLCPSGQYPLLGNICLEDNNSDEIDLDKSFLRSSRLPHDHLPTFGHSQGQT